MSAVLTDNLPLLAGAPIGIKKLRELILELAVRGKLVPQDANDEPASDLLKRIAEEKARLVAEGKIKKQKPLAEISEKEKPFDVPTNWEWVRVAAVGHDWGQKTPDKKFTYIDVGAVDNSAGKISSPQVLRAEDAPSRARKVVRPGTVIYSTIRPYLLNVAVIEEVYEQEPIASTAFAIIHPYLEMPARYFLCFLRSPVFVRYVESVQMGIAYPAINDGQFFSGLIPLPPLPEQHRIVAKVDELMALCDRLEARQADADSAHVQLLQVLLGSLTQGSDAEDFAQSWQCLAEHFHTVFTTESSIDALKQTLLQLAVMGKLVSQDPTDEPASKLLRTIAAEKDRLVKAKRFKAIKKIDDIEQGSTNFQLPAGWEWSRLADVALQITDGAHHTPVYVEAGVPFLSVKDMSSGRLDFGTTRFISEETHEQLVKRCRPELGDLLLTKIGTTGVPVVVDTDQSFSIFVSVALIKAPWSLLNVNYIRLLMDSPLVKRQSLEGTEGVGNKNLVLGKIANFLIAIPPLAEQHRIVAKVDQLMALCDQLKARLNQARQVHEHLASALVEQAVA